METQNDRTGKVACGTHRWGRTHGGTPALRVAVPVGSAAAIAIGVARVMLGNPDGPLKWVAGVILGVCLAPALVALVWVLLVDRRTIPGAVPNPQASVESAWYDRAATDSFHVVLAVSGLGAGAASLLSATVVSWTLIAMFVVAAAAFWISYAIRRTR